MRQNNTIRIRPTLSMLRYLLISLSLLMIASFTPAIASENNVQALVDAARRLPMNDPEKERLYRVALKRSPSNPRVLFNLALLLQANGKYADAIPFYQNVLKQDSSDAIAHYNLANVMLALDDPNLWQSSAWHFRQFMFYGKKGVQYNKTEKFLNTLEENLAARYSSYQNKFYSRDQLASILGQVDTDESARGSSKYDGPRIPLMLNFAAQSAELTPAAKQQLDQVAAALTIPALRNDRIQIEGYTDSHEHPKFEQRLRYARQRAEQVRAYLQEKHHLSVRRFTIKAVADLEIISANNTPEGRAANRRVELYNLGKGKKIAAPLHE